ncbi:MAG: hypothetical protein QF921_06815 [Pseudomonadales bacterium]|jgi:hypothetical protein|nr:hypothetical protein [Pseudomonadales bacterium]MDP6469549.1 hypothetical protein [Pseudomonadales bacterium]MDP6827390.1 hypothetical protein [Pseudomonadales bacterium]MDP6971213.1 hypothetical protein [Pseudomonadales bacterium]|tara:strand:- start:966 stop:2804 length:1839 start_codon:yes stop_codon:yes gene_type:complete
MDSSDAPRIARPEPDLDTLSFTDLTLIGEWVASLPVANTDQTAFSLARATDEIARLKLDFAERLDALEAIRSTVEYVCTRLDQAALQSSGRDSAQAQVAQRLQANLSIGYKAVVFDAASALRDNRSETPNGAKSSQASEAKESLPLAIHRAISDLSRILLRTLQQYVPPTPNLWLELNQMYALAEHLELTENTVLDSANQSDEPSTINDAYLRAVLLSAARPNQLRHTQLSQVFNALELWTPRVRIEAANDDAVFMLDLQADMGPLYQRLAIDLKDPRAVRSELLAFEIEAYLKEIDTEIPIPDNVTKEVLQHAMAAWGRMRQRAHRRLDAQGSLKVCVGFSSAHYYLSGGVEFNDQLSNMDALIKQEVNPFLDTEGPELDVVDDDVWNDAIRVRIPKNPNVVDPQKLLLERAPAARKDQDAANRHRIFETSIVDISPGGYHVNWNSDKPKNLQTGELLAIREEGDPRWRIAVMRWIHQDISNLVAGMQLIAPRAIAVAARVVQKKGGPTNFARAFLLPEIRAINQSPTLITPSLPFRKGHKVHIQRQGIQSTAQIQDDVISTQSFNQFTFRMLDGYLENAQINLSMANLSKRMDSDDNQQEAAGEDGKEQR